MNLITSNIIGGHMRKITGSLLIITLILMLATLSEVPVSAKSQSPADGFSIKTESECRTYDAKVTVYEHDRTGAQVVVIKNDDPNRYFMISFDTPVDNNKGMPHVLEHAAMNGCKKYPSRSLTMSLMNRAYITFANAFTMDKCTAYPVASLSEEELLAIEDYYTDSCFEPLILSDEDIFRTEAWRYELADEQSDITVKGTIYSEMQGRYTADIAAARNAVKLINPNDKASNEPGGIPADILTLTYDEVVDFHEKYYHPSNCTAYIYGNINDINAHLDLLAGYFDKYDRKDCKDTETVGKSSSGFFIEKKYDHPATEGSEVSGRTEIAYAIDCGNLSDEELIRLYAFASYCNMDSSSVGLRLKSLYPLSTFQFDVQSDDQGDIFYVIAHGMNEGDAALFRKNLGTIFDDIAAGGIASKEIDRFRIRKKAEAALSREGSMCALTLLTQCANMESCGRGPLFYMNMRDSYIDMDWFDNDYVKSVAKDMLTSPKRSSMAIVSPKPGLIEENEKKLAEKLAAKKASMSDAQIAELIKQTKSVAAKANDDPSEYLEELNVVKVSDLTDELKEHQVTDSTDNKGTRRIGITTETEGVNYTKITFDATGLSQDELHYLALYTDLVNGHFIPTGAISRNDIPGIAGDCTIKGMEMSLSVSGLGDDYKPYVAVQFISTPDMVEKAYALAFERMFNSDFSDTSQIAEGIASIRNTVKKNIENHPEKVAYYSALSCDGKGAAYYNETHYSGYYDFLTGLEKSKDDYKEASSKLKKIAKYLHNSNGAMLGYAVTKKDEKAYMAVADKFMSTLEDNKREASDYKFTRYSFPLAVPLSIPMMCNAISTGDVMSVGLDKDEAVNEVAFSIIVDKYLMPVLRDELGAYGCDYIYDYPVLSFYTINDPETTKALDVFKKMPEAWKKIRTGLGKDSLDEYILKCYSAQVLSEGEMSDAINVLSNMMNGSDKNERQKKAAALKKIKPEDLEAFDEVFENLAKDGHLVTVGPDKGGFSKEYKQTVSVYK